MPRLSCADWSDYLVSFYHQSFSSFHLFSFYAEDWLLNITILVSNGVRCMLSLLPIYMNGLLWNCVHLAETKGYHNLNMNYNLILFSFYIFHRQHNIIIWCIFLRRIHIRMYSEEKVKKDAPQILAAVHLVGR